MERWLLTVESNCSDPSRVKDFNDWYDRVHLPDILLYIRHHSWSIAL